MKSVLITGGAGFIGQRLARRLLREGFRVSVLDCFSNQIHGGIRTLPADLLPHVQLRVADVRDRGALAQAMKGAQAIVHFAAETGTGQSMYEVQRYSDVNIGATAGMMDILVNSPSSDLERIVVASSRAVYGEGSYVCPEHGRVHPAGRDRSRLDSGKFEPACPQCSADLTPTATREDAPLAPTSFYGLTKQIQEQLTLMFAGHLGISAIALRYQNVFGPGQSLVNPYTGILSIFFNLARQNREIRVFEDGKESRDFVFVDDVVDATVLSLSADYKGCHAMNVGSGHPVSVQEVASLICEQLGSGSKIRVTGEFRIGDIRHNVADVTRAREMLGYQARVGFRAGLSMFIDWASRQPEQAPLAYEASLQEMKSKGLMSG